MKKEKQLIKILLVTLSVLCLMSVIGCNDTAENTTDTLPITQGTTKNTNTTSTTGTTDHTEPTESNTPDEGGESPDVEPVRYAVSVINGCIDTEDGDGTYVEGTQINLLADTPSKGYVFSHWENADGVMVGTETQLGITVSRSDTYKAYYTVAFGESDAPETTILSDLSKDWQQGGINGDFTSFDVGNNATKHRVSFAEPFLLKKGESMTVSIPNDTTWTCPYASDGKDDTVPCEGGCVMAVGRLILKKNGESESGKLLTDYKIQNKSWLMGGFRYEASEDVYIMITIKYHKHGSTAFDVNKPIMQELNITHSIPSVADEALIGAYWKPEIEDALEKIEANREEIGEDISEFFFITDVHWKDCNAKNSPALINYLAEKLDAYFVVFGGDVIELNATRLGAINDEALDFYKALEGYTKTGEKLKILSTLGNHDRNFLSRNPDLKTILTDQDVYDIYVARTERWAVTLKDNPYCSYYDDVDQKVRYLQFTYASNTVDNAGDKFEAIMQWSEQQIKALSADWTVVLISHGVFGGNEDEYADMVKDRVLKWQAESHAEIAIWISGHTHADYNEILVSTDGKSAVRAISLNGDSYGKTATHTKEMNYGTATEQSFAFLQIDKNTQTIRLTRIGASDDLVFTYGDAMVGEYNNTPSHSIRVVNGTVNGLYYIRCKDGEQIKLVADRAPTGYAFSCWKNLKGEVVGTTATLIITPTESTQYKPYYVDVDPTDDEVGENEVMTDLANDWMQGGLSNMPVEWWLDGSLRESRICFAEPILLKKGQTITVTRPTIDCPTGTCPNGCKLAVLIAAMDKTGETETGFLPMEYSVYYSQWKTSFTATKDTYVVVMIKYDKHGNIPFSKTSEDMKDVRIVISSKEKQGEV